MMIASASNEKIKEVKKLMKSAKERREKGLFVVEGIRMVREIPRQDVVTIFVAEKSEATFRQVLDDFSETEIVCVRDFVFESMSDTNTPQGILALVRMKTYSFRDILGVKDQSPFVLILEKLQDPGNLGTILRTAEGAGATGIMMSSDSVDLYNPKVIRSTMGSVFRMPVYVSKDMLTDVEHLRTCGVTVYGAHLHGNTFYEKNFSGACGFLIGNEGNGLTEALCAKADELIRIPMRGQVESLNAATSVAVIAYEVLRQRL